MLMRRIAVGSVMLLTSVRDISSAHSGLRMPVSVAMHRIIPDICTPGDRGVLDSGRNRGNWSVTLCTVITFSFSLQGLPHTLTQTPVSLRLSSQPLRAVG